jgi:hypothetical protein
LNFLGKWDLPWVFLEIKQKKKRNKIDKNHFTEIGLKQGKIPLGEI